MLDYRKGISMSKPLIKDHTKVKDSISILDIKSKNIEESKFDSMGLDRILKRNRSKKYLELIEKLDAGSCSHSNEYLESIIDDIKNEFYEIDISDFMIGIVSRCFLGDTYEVHILDLFAKIVKHYTKGEQMPPEFERVRSMTIHNNYLFIEIYNDACRAIGRDGSVSVVKFK